MAVERKSILNVTGNFRMGFLITITSLSFYMKMMGLGDSSFWINEADNTRMYYFSTAREMLAWGSPEVLGVGIYSLVTYFYGLLLPDGFLLETEIGYRLPSVAFSTITIPMLYLLSRRFSTPVTSLAICSLWAFNPLGFELSRWFYTYSQWTFFTLLSFLTYFHLVDSIRAKKTKMSDWVIFHLVSIITFMTNIFIMLAYLSVLPHFLSTVNAMEKPPEARRKLIFCAFGPHFLPCIYIIQRSLRLSSQGLQEASWIDFTPTNPILHILEISFPLTGFFLFFILFYFLILSFYRFWKNNSIPRSLVNYLPKIRSLLRNDLSPLYLAAVTLPIFFIILGLLGNPSWEDRYFVHLIPIWQLIAVLFLVSNNSQISNPKSDSSQHFSSLIIIGFILISITSSLAIVVQEDAPIRQDVRSSIQIISNEWKVDEKSAIITQPTPNIYRYYLDRFELEPEFLEGSWDEIEPNIMNNIISSEPDVIYRVTMLEFVETDNFLLPVSRDYELEQEFFPTGMRVQKWNLMEK